MFHKLLKAQRDVIDIIWEQPQDPMEYEKKKIYIYLYNLVQKLIQAAK